MKITFLVGISLVLFFSCNTDDSKVQIVSAPSAIGTKENPQMRLAFELMQIADPKTGKIPLSIHYKEREFANQSQSRIHPNAKKTTLDWKLAGPINVGGRTRAMALDILDEKIIVAGGVSGGMWRSDDNGKNWERTSHPATLNSATCIIQDHSPGQQQVWYHGTGELRGNSARIDATPYRGDGIFKSVDGGKSWDVLPSTSFGQYAVFDSPFNYVWNLQIKSSNTGPGELYAALYGCIVRSLDGGMTWETVLGHDLINSDLEDLNLSGASYYSNILILPSGEMYATLSTQTAEEDDLENKGIFRSTDGVNWVNITPTGFTTYHDRIILSFAPSDPRILYFWAANNAVNHIWKRNNGTWTNCSSVLPSSDDDDLAVLDTQDSYNMIIKVYPNNPDVVFFGGTNLYRTTDGFRSTENLMQIGGYDLEKTFQPYSGHHPDQHELVFYPSDPNKMLSASDGGIRLTYNNLASEPSWSSLNNGYVTTQFYSIALSKKDGSGTMVGGMQDNGSFIKALSGETIPWKQLLGGDGSFCAATPDDLFWYVSFQQGNVFRLSINSNQELKSFAQVDPSGGGGYLFINPFILDPNNYNRMYLAGGEVMWRNDNLTQIAEGRQEPTPVNWTAISTTRLSGSTITALDVSTHPAHVLYYGSSPGIVFRLDSANSTQATRIQIHSQQGYVTSISVDPSDADHVLWAYGNYNVQSIFSTTNGGILVDHVSGNLEENEDGSGNGPSIRWCEIVPLIGGTFKYFVGTSTGVYSTTSLEGSATTWVREGENTVGHSVVRMMDYRSSDGRIVVATHGNGVFESTVPNTLEIVPVTANVDQIVVENGYPNPFTDSFKISLVIPEQDRVTIFVVNASGQVIKRLLDAPQFAGEVLAVWDGTNAAGVKMPAGMYFYHILYRDQLRAGKMLLNQQ